MQNYSLSQVADHVLLRDLASLVSQDRATTASLLAHIAEVDERRLYAGAGFPSMYDYCVGRLRMSEDMAFKRIQAARAARKAPAILAMLADGRLHLTGVVRLAPHLTTDNAGELLAAATHQTKAAIEQMLAERFPRPDLVALVTPLDSPDPIGPLVPEPVAPCMAAQVAPVAGAFVAMPVSPPAAPAAMGPVAVPEWPARVFPLSPGRFGVQFTFGTEAHEKLRQAQALLGHAVPSGALAEVFERALEALVERLEKRKFGAPARPRPAAQAGEGPRSGRSNKRHIPAAIRREVKRRDGGRCTFVGDGGKRCEARAKLEFDHRVPVAHGGQTTAANLRLRCRTHNQYEAERSFGAGFMQRKRAEAGRAAAKRQAAARAREAERARREARARELDADAAARARALEVIPWLRTLGFRADEARRAAARCEALPEAPLEERVRFALKGLAPASARRVAAAAP